MKAGVYKIQHKGSGRIYIGSSSDIRARLSAHKLNLARNTHHSKSLQNAWNKYGRDCFVFEPLIICAVENLLMYEQTAIDYYQSYKKPQGYNIRKFAESNRGIPTSLKQKAALRKLWTDPEYRGKMSQKATVRMKDPIFKANFIAASLKFRKDNPEIETKRKALAAKANSARCRGVPLKSGHIKKVRDTKRRKRASGEWVPKVKHGMAETPEYGAWCKMLGRCNNPKDAKYSTVGAQGIKVCSSWEKSFEQFYKDMGPRPKGLFLGRKDIGKNYNKSNCRWSTAKMLSHSSRTVKLVKLCNEMIPLSEAGRRLGIYFTSIAQRARDTGESLQQATDHFARKKGLK